MNPTWQIQLLGELRVQGAGRVIDRFQRHTTGALLAYLAYHLEQSHPREKLIDLLWPDSEPAAGRQNLSQALSWLRRALELTGPERGHVIPADRQTVCLNPTVVTTDVAAFQGALRSAEMARTSAQRIEWLRAAKMQYQGELLPGFYEEWVAPEREALAEGYLKTLGQLSELLELSGDLDGALEHARLAVIADPLREALHQRLIRLYGALGRPTEARRRFQELARILHVELGVAPSKESQWLLEQAVRGDGAARWQSCEVAETPAPPRSPCKNGVTSPPHNLPIHLTSFIGQRLALAEAKRMLSDQDTGEGGSMAPLGHAHFPTRLLTLTGEGGCGKTRLALETAAQLLEQYSDGVWLVELAPLTDPGLVPQALAQALGVLLDGSKPVMQVLTGYLKPKSLLLILDNCEHLLDACASLVDALLRACPRLKVLATSREGLGIAGELIYRVPSLSLPDPKQPVSIENLSRYTAVQLFIERASFSKPGFILTNVNGPSLAQVCHRLDGIPLAIELAATRLRVMTVEQIAARLDDVFRLLTGGNRTALPRHQTLRALIDWSYNLLSEQERVLLRRLSVFMGGWTLEGADAVCGSGEYGCAGVGPDVGTPAQPDEVLDLLGSLVEKSLVSLEETEGGGRYQWLETVRQYAKEKLLESGEQAALRERHLGYFVAFAEEAEERCRGAEQIEWLDRLEAEHDNLRAALEWAGSKPDGDDTLLRLAAALGHFWGLRGYIREGLGALERALDCEYGPAYPRLVRARALEAATSLYSLHDLGSHAMMPRPLGWMQEAEDLYRQAGDRAGATRALAWLAYLVLRSEPERGKALAMESLALAREQDDRHSLVRILWLAARPEFWHGDREPALALLEDGLALCRESGSPGDVARAAWQLGFFSWWSGKPERARPLLEEALACSREVKDRWLTADCQQYLAEVEALSGNEQEQIERLEESVRLIRAMGADLGWRLLLLVKALLRRGAADRAEVLLEETIALQNHPHELPAIVEGRSLLSHLARQRGDDKAARAHEACALRLAREAPENERIHCLGAMGHAARAFGRFARARTLYDESLELRRKSGDLQLLAWSLEDYGVLAAMEGKNEWATRILGATEVQAERLGRTLPMAEVEDYHRAVTLSKAAMGEAAFDAAWAEGRAMALEQAVEYAMETEGTPAP